MSVPKRVKANIKAGNIPPRVSSLQYYLALLKWHFKYFKKFDKKSFWTGIIAGLVRAPLGAGTIFITGLFVDSIVSFYNQPSYVTLISFAIPVPVLYIVALVVFARLSRILDAISNIAHIRIKNNAIGQYKEDVAEKFHKLNSQEVDRELVKNLLTKTESYWLTNATNFYSSLMSLGGYIVSIIITFAALFTVSPLFAVLVLLSPLPEVYAVYKHSRIHAHFVDDIAPLLLERNYFFSALTDIRTFPERKVNGVFHALIERYRHVAALVAEGYKRVLVRGEKETTEINVLDNLFLTVLKVVVLINNLIQKVAVGHITATLGYIDSLYRNSFDLQNTVIGMFDQLTFIEYLRDFLAIEGFADARKKGRRLKPGMPRIAFDEVSFAYPDSGKEILNDASLTINPGDKVMIYGKDGSGKSSILSIIAGLYQLSNGAVRFNGLRHEKLARGQVKAKMSIVPEDFARYYMTVRENIMLGDPRKTFDAKLYKKALAVTGLDVWLKENSIDDTTTILGNYFRDSLSISSGHWQRLAIARAVYRNRDIFVLDQPFTYIDHDSMIEIFPRLLKFIGKRTLIFVSEQRIFKESFNRMFEMQDKKLKETGIKKLIN